MVTPSFLEDLSSYKPKSVHLLGRILSHWLCSLMVSVSPLTTMSEFLVEISNSSWVGNMCLKGYGLSHMVTKLGDSPVLPMLTPCDLHHRCPQSQLLSLEPPRLLFQKLNIEAAAGLQTRFHTVTSGQLRIQQVCSIISWGGRLVELAS